VCRRTACGSNNTTAYYTAGAMALGVAWRALALRRRTNAGLAGPLTSSTPGQQAT
jgi:hypothetical protein